LTTAASSSSSRRLHSCCCTWCNRCLLLFISLLLLLLLRYEPLHLLSQLHEGLTAQQALQLMQRSSVEAAAAEQQIIQR
jgi:hypothetical protein